jgi:3-hydroxyacyl-CoA dehydrogenase
MINEGTKILEEGIAIRPSDIDVVFVFGYGFPAFRGGLMHYADEVGMRKIRNKLLKYAELYPNVPYFQPSNLMNELADGKVSLSKYWKKKVKAAN